MRRWVQRAIVRASALCAPRVELLDSVEQTGLPVTEKVASILAPFAYTFYRPFPERMLTAWDLIKFGLPGCQNDLLMIVLMGVAGGLLGTLIPLATGAIFDSVIPGAARGALFQLSLALVVSALAAAPLSIDARYCQPSA